MKFEEPSLRPWKINCRHNVGIEKNHVRVVEALEMSPSSSLGRKRNNYAIKIIRRRSYIPQSCPLIVSMKPSQSILMLKFLLNDTEPN